MVAAGKEANFTKHADVAAWARVGCGRHFWVAVGVVRISCVVATAAPKEEYDESEEGQESQDANYDASDGAS